MSLPHASAFKFGVGPGQGATGQADVHVPVQQTQWMCCWPRAGPPEWQHCCPITSCWPGGGFYYSKAVALKSGLTQSCQPADLKDLTLEVSDPSRGPGPPAASVVLSCACLFLKSKPCHKSCSSNVHPLR